MLLCQWGEILCSLINPQVDFSTLKTRQQTGNFQVHTNPPVCVSLWTVDIKIPKTNLFHAFEHCPCRLIARHTNLFAFIGVKEAVDEVVVTVVDGTRGQWRGSFQIVEELVEMLVLLLETHQTTT